MRLWWREFGQLSIRMRLAAAALDVRQVQNAPDVSKVRFAALRWRCAGGLAKRRPVVPASSPTVEGVFRQAVEQA